MEYMEICRATQCDVLWDTIINHNNKKGEEFWVGSARMVVVCVNGWDVFICVMYVWCVMRQLIDSQADRVVG